MMTMTSIDTDIVIVGAGPAGCTGAILARERGLDVVVLEREQFPRFQIGESLLPAAWDLWTRLGIRESVENAGYPIERGVLFRIQDTNDTTEFLVRTDEYPDYFINPFTFHVDRAHFDQLLLDRARTVGADVRTGHKVDDVLFDGTRASGVSFTGPDGVARELRARFVIDASGRRTLLASKLGLRQQNPELRKVAYYTHFEGAGRRLAEDGSTVTDIHSTDGGWIWYIPLRNDLVSVGVVLDAAFVQKSDLGPEELFRAAIHADDFVSGWLKGATQRMDLLKIPSISYLSERFVGDGFLLVGDAAMFIDPIFSAGVMLAMRGADYAIETIAGALAAGDVSAERLRSYEERIRKPIGKMNKIILNWYQIMQHKNRNHIFRLSQTAPLLREQLVILLSGGYDKADLDAFLVAQGS
jgi:halogenation protein CepH